MKSILLAVVPLVFAAVPAHAVTTAVATCSVLDVSPAAEDCAGFFSGNLLNGSPAALLKQESALSALGFDWDGDFSSVEKLKLQGSKVVDFSTLLQGVSFIGVHYGAGRGGPGNATAFYKIDAGAGLDTFMLNFSASSNAVLYSTAAVVPEPGSYALMLAGLAAIGFIVRRRS